MQENTNVLNIINFIRACEPREPVDLLQAVRDEMELSLQYDFPTTWLFQYDALRDRRYVDYVRSHMAPSHECGIWFEVVQENAEKAGIQWRGRWPWDWQMHCGNPVGYTPEERERLADVFLEEFRSLFGYYPASVGAWVLDAHLLGYLHDRYGIRAACNCKDQYGTDGMSLWGGYWANAYYPSKLNAYMPAQTREGQIDVPVFRMLGSDPLEQYDLGKGTEWQHVISLEGIYPKAGGNPAWVDWFLKENYRDPHFALAYAQAGQENSFSSQRILPGLKMQYPKFDALRKKGILRIETLKETADWFRARHAQTPVTASVTLEDKPGKDRQGIWYLSAFQRLNLIRTKQGSLQIRDWHVFDERLEEAYLRTPCRTTHSEHVTPPVMDSFFWGNALFTLSAGPARLTDLRDEGSEHLSAVFGNVRILCTPSGLEIRNSEKILFQFDPEVLKKQGVTLETTEKEVRYHWRGREYGFRLGQGFVQAETKLIVFQAENGCIRFRIFIESRSH